MTPKREPLETFGWLDFQVTLYNDSSVRIFDETRDVALRMTVRQLLTIFKGANGLYQECLNRQKGNHNGNHRRNPSG